MVYVDFSKAYDRVPRGKLFNVLKSLGCGSVMLAALVAMYRITTCILGSTIIKATLGVRQGAPTSCFLFVVYVDMLIRLIKTKVDDDDFLCWLHTLMLMDDTIILASTRDKLIEKLGFLSVYCKQYGMIINEDKTKLMVIHGNIKDRETIQLGPFAIKHCDKYVYLGAIFTADGSISSSINEHVKEKTKCLNKLLIFLAANYDAPFFVKRKVFQAAFTASILYSIESWVGAPLKAVETIYMKGVKALLGVRNPIPNDLCLLEAGIPPLQSVVLQAQAKFFKKLLPTRILMDDDPFGYICRLCEQEGTGMWAEIQRIISVADHIKEGLQKLNYSITNKDGTRAETYRYMNPTLTIHPLYTKHDFIPDSLRISFTRLRLSSHKLRIELGRWSHIQRSDRVCECGILQDEKHILLCNKNINILQKFSYEGKDLILLFADLDSRKLLMLKELIGNLEP